MCIRDSVIAYGLIKFVFDVDLHFIHLYAVLFLIEAAIMLTFGYLSPKTDGRHFKNEPKVDLTPWKYSWAASSTMLMFIALIYLLFSPIGLVDGVGASFWLLSSLLILINFVFCVWSVKKLAE